MLEQFFVNCSVHNRSSTLWSYKEAPTYPTFGQIGCFKENLPGAHGPYTNYNAPGGFAYSLKEYSLLEQRMPALGFVGVFDQKIFPRLLYVDELLCRVKDEFTKNFFHPAKKDYRDFDQTFRQLKEEFESKQVQRKARGLLGGYRKIKGCCSSMFPRNPRMSLEKTVLEPHLKALEEKLIAKEVAKNIAEELRESVAAILEGKKLARCKTISSAVRVTMEEILVHALTPKQCYSIVALHQKNYVGRHIRKTLLPTVPQVFIDSVVNDGVKGSTTSNIKRKDVIYTDGLKHPENLIREAIHEAIIDDELRWWVICVVVSSPKQAAVALLTAYLSGAEIFMSGNLKDIASEGPEYITYRQNLKKIANYVNLIKEVYFWDSPFLLNLPSWFQISLPRLTQNP
ncbi:unnamed protein product [Malus baccata var. baccata]